MSSSRFLVLFVSFLILAVFAPSAFSADPPELIVRRPPQVVTELSWWRDKSPKATAKEKKDILDQVTLSIDALTDAVDDILARFSKCPVGIAEAEEAGTLEKLYVPYQVVFGQFRLMQLQGRRLEYRLKDKRVPHSEWVGEFQRYYRRIEGAGVLISQVAQNSERDYQRTLQRFATKLRPYAERWNVFDDDQIRYWVARWQLIGENITTFLERSPEVLGVLSDPSKRSIVRATERYRKIREQLGAFPWAQNLEDQERLAKEIYEASMIARLAYKDLSDDCETQLGVADKFLSFTLMLGANEGLATFANAIEKSLKP